MTKNWYVIHVYSGFEKKIAEHIEEQARKADLADSIETVIVPSEQVVEVKKGRRISNEQKLFPGYVLVKMELTDHTWHLIKNTPKVTGFLGSKTQPIALQEGEAKRILALSQEGSDKARAAATFESGEQVRVTDGPFSSFNGIIEEVDAERRRLKVSVLIFGRSTPVELEFSQVSKLS